MSKRPGHHIARINKGHPRREARRMRAVAREAIHTCWKTCKRFRTGRVEWPDEQAVRRFARDTIRQHGVALDALGDA